MPQDKPHLLRIYVSDEGFYEYSIDCPHDNDRPRPCGIFEECTVHPAPEEPEMEAPPFQWTDAGKLVRDEEGHYLYSEDADPQAVAEWNAYDKAYRVWETEHDVEGGIGYHRNDGVCWVQDMIDAEMITESWDLVGFHKVEVISPVKVRWFNRGAAEDTFLELHPWEQPDEATNDRS